MNAAAKKAAIKAINDAKNMPGATAGIAKLINAGWRESDIAGFYGMTVGQMSVITRGMYERLEIKGVDGFYANGIS
jgi:hypothetical protein